MGLGSCASIDILQMEKAMRIRYFTYLLYAAKNLPEGF